MGNQPFSVGSHPDHVDLRDSSTSASLAAFAPISLVLDVNGQLEPIGAQVVSGNYFDVLGVDIPVGRTFNADEDRADALVRVAVATSLMVCSSRVPWDVTNSE